MKNIIKHITLCGLLAVGAGMALTSCDDFLTITPTNQIVEEEFWKDKKDLNSAVMACYKRMIASDLVSRYIYWGEERSDNVEPGPSVSATSDVVNIMNANLLPTYSQFDWTPMYQAINYCNKVLSHGPTVVKSDESFSQNDWSLVQAEVITLRALCHFYLVRAYGEIPYIDIDYNNNSQELRTAQSTQLTVLNNIIDDLESIKDNVAIDYGTAAADNKGRVTRKMVYTLLADVYLWRASYKAGNNQPFKKVILTKSYQGPLSEEELTSRTETYGTSAEEDYQACIDYCDRVIDMVIQEKKDYIEEEGLNVGGAEIKLDLEDLLAPNEESSQKAYLSSRYAAYTTIFGKGNSDESIFELQVYERDYTNGAVTSLFTSNSATVGTFTGAEALFGGINENPNDLKSNYVFSKTDYRRWESIVFAGESQKTFPIGKYINTELTQLSPNSSTYMMDNSDEKLTTRDISATRRTTANANWIIYRLSEVYLMKAEAMSQLYDDAESLAQAFKYVRAVFKRSNPYAYSTNNTRARLDSLTFKNNYDSKDGMEALVMTERHREFVGEGKRWFDLVRYAQRRGRTAEMLEMLSKKYTNSKSIQAKLADMQSLFLPVYNTDIKNNNWLYQNGVWQLNESSSRDEN